MITGFEVGAVFKIINEASPALAQILKQVRELNSAITKAKENLATLGASLNNIKLGTAVGETESLAAAWGLVARNARAAQAAIGQASSASATSAGAAGAATRNAATGGRRGAARGSGGGPHLSGPSFATPGGGHLRFGGAGAGIGAMVGYSAYEAAELEKAAWWMTYHSGQAQTKENHDKFGKILQDSMARTGFNLSDTSGAAMDALRMFKGTPGGGLDVLPEMLEIAAKESLAKGEGLKESMKAFIGLAHMTKEYSPEQIKKLAPAFAFLSTANPSRLGSIERAAGYAVPLLQSGMDIDPLTTLLLGTALTRAGAVNTRSGTWLREMMIRSMPPTDLDSEKEWNKRHDALLALGLVDKNNKPTWFTNGKPDPLKMLDIAGAKAAGIPLTDRVGIERKLFGAQGGGGFALLADPAVREQVQSLKKEMASPGFLNQYNSMLPDYMSGSTAQNARTGMAEFNNTMMDLGKMTLPAINEALRGFKSILEGIRSVLPNSDGKSAAKVGGGAILGGVLGGVAGIPFGPVGIAGGAAIGAGIGGGIAASAVQGATQDKKETDEFIRALREAGTSGRAPEVKQQATLAPISLTINMDGTMIAQAVTKAQASVFSTQAAAFDGFGLPTGGDHNYTDK